MSDFAQQYKSARDSILALLADRKFHSWTELKGVGGVRYGARLLELRRLGWQMESIENSDDGKSYRLLSTEPEKPQVKRVKIFMTEEDAARASRGELTGAAKEAVAQALASFRVNKDKL